MMKLTHCQWMTVIAVANASWFAGACFAEDDLQAGLRERMSALEGMIETRGDAAIERFIDRHVAEGYRKTFSSGKLETLLEEIRAACANAGDIRAIPSGEDGVRLVFDGDSGTHTVAFQLESQSPYRIDRLDFSKGQAIAGEARREAVEPVTWRTLKTRLREEASKGFTGCVLVVRDGETVLNEGYGLANRTRGYKNTPETVFAIGSTPIDFTLAGILLLRQQDKLSLTDSITKFFPDVPDDKRAISIEHLMTGRSGLRNFHDVPSDRDPDHSWISRDEAMRRILSSELVFAPGRGQAHSHSAWGVLAAIIEIVSGQSYPQFTREHLLMPLGMRDTGFNGEPVAEERLAIGYGVRSDGKTNAPPYWGKTSWLVMGSGGQVSTTVDMSRWIQAIHAGRMLNEENTKLYLRQSQGLLNGGDQYGFEIYYTYSPGTYMILMANAVDDTSRQAVAQLARAIGDLVLAESGPPFTLGVGLGFDGGRLVISQLVPGGAAERDGLRKGDIVSRIGRRDPGDDPLAILIPYLHSGEPIPFEIKRGDIQKDITVRPKRR